MQTLSKWALLLALGLGLGFAACILPNPDHCYNRAINANDWCEVMRPDEPYCSPCEAENNGCVAEEPDTEECPGYYSDPGTDTGTDTGDESGTDTGDESGTDTGEGETGGTETSG